MHHGMYHIVVSGARYVWDLYNSVSWHPCLISLYYLYMPLFFAFCVVIVCVVLPLHCVVPDSLHVLMSLIFPNIALLFIFSCDQAALWMVQSVRPSVRLSVCLSVRLSHLFDYVPIILSSWNFQELLPVTKVTSMQKVKVRGQRSRSQRSRPKFSFPDCNSSLNSHMMMKWYI